MVGVKGLEPPTSCSQSRRATNCATPRQYEKLSGLHTDCFRQYNYYKDFAFRCQDKTPCLAYVVYSRQMQQALYGWFTIW